MDSDTEEVSDQQDSDTNTIGRIETISVGAAGQAGDDVVVNVGVQSPRHPQEGMDRVDS